MKDKYGYFTRQLPSGLPFHFKMFKGQVPERISIELFFRNSVFNFQTRNAGNSLLIQAVVSHMKERRYLIDMVYQANNWKDVSVLTIGHDGRFACAVFLNDGILKKNIREFVVKDLFNK